jgi:hypothetical protein
MATTIVTKNSATAGSAPSAGALSQGELAVNVADKRLFTKDSGGSVVEVGTNPGGAVTFTAGSASAPAITTTGDTNTGIFFPAADTIAFSEGGTEAMRIDSSGNLLVGTTSSDGVSGGAFKKGAATSCLIEISGGNGTPATNSLAIGQDASTVGYVYQRANQALIFGTNNTERMRLDASGNLGIGTSSPVVDGKGLNIVNSSGVASLRVKDNSGGTGFDFLQASGAGYVWNRDNNVILFGTNNTERMRIDGSGNLLVGATSAVGLGLTLFPAATMVFNNNAASSGHLFHSFRRSGVEIGYIDQNGTTAVRYITSSDYRLKENVAPMTGALDKVALLKPVTYKWKIDGSDGQGFIAHELAEVCPEAVSGEKDAVDENGSIKPQGIDTSFLVATLTAAIQELKAEVDSLKAQLASQ